MDGITKAGDSMDHEMRRASTKIRTLIADPKSAGSLGNRMRRRRFELFAARVSKLPRPLRILDVGGTPAFWEQMGFAASEGVSFVLVNPEPASTTRANFQCLPGDARSMPEFKRGDFDIVFSNSVIEHVGDPADQAAMADEIKRIGERYFVQTPNRGFVIEPHFLFPGFHWMPLAAQAQLLRRLPLAYSGRIEDPDAARRAAAGIRLMSCAELRHLFPAATIERERVIGMTKSFTALAGW